MAAEGITDQLIARAQSLAIPLDAVLAERLTRYYDLLVHWNRTINLTSLNDREEALDRLIIEPLAAARSLPSRPDLMDVGSGGGSPGIPLALALEATSLLLVESNQRKSAFLREVLRQLEMRTASVAAIRFEELSSSETGPKTLISIRAVKMDGDLFRRFEAFLAPDGTVALFTSRQAAVNQPDNHKGVSTIQLIPSRGSILQLFR